MPRLGWLALGLFGGAVAVESLGAGAKLPAALLVAVGWIGGGLLCLVARPGARDLERVGLVVLGAGLALGRTALGAEAPPPPLPTGEGPWVGVVEAVGSSRDGRQRVVVSLEPGGPAILLDLPPEPRLGPADVIRFDGRLELPPPTAYGDYLRRSGLAGSATARTSERMGRRESPAALLATARTAAADALARTIPEPEAGLAAGILVGLRERVDRGVAADFATAGLSHIVAISGWNIAIVGAAVATLSRRAGRSRRAWLTIAAVVAYVAFVGPSASVVRAATMALVVLLVGLSGRSTRASAALAAAVCGLLLIDPAWATEPGFQLSVAATAGLIRWGTPFAEGLAVLTGRRLPAWLTEVVGVSLAAQLATLPIVVAAFGRVSLVAPLANVVVVPLVPIAMGLAGIALVGGLLSGVVAPFVGVVGSLAATVAGMPAWLVLRVIVTTADLAAGLPFASLAVPEPTGTLVAGAAGLAVVGLARGRRGSEAALRRAARGGGGQARPGRTQGAGRSRWRKPAAIVVVPVLAVLLAAAYRPGGDPIVVVFDVGQGDAILVEGGRGGRLLVDGGPDPGRLLRLLDARLPPWDRRLDVVVVSHPHEDHVAGLPTLLTRYRVGPILTNGMAGTGPAATTLAELLVGDRRAVVAAAGDRLAVDGVTLDVVWPVAGTVPATAPDSGSEVNDASLVLLGAAVGHRFLLSGDIEEGVDPELVARGLPRLDLLKVPHHGSRTATTAGLLEATRPSLAVISVGADNPYGHPAPETLERLRAAGATVLRTDEDGSVEIVFRPGAMEVHSAAGVRTFGTEVRTFGARSRSDAAAPTRDRRSGAPPTGAPLVPAPSPGGVPGPSPSASVGLAHAPLRLEAAPPRPWPGAGSAAGIGYDRLDGFPRAGRSDDRRPPPAGGVPSGDPSPSPRVGSAGRRLRGRARPGPDRLRPTARTRHGHGHSARPTLGPTARPPRGPPRRMARRGDAVTGSDGARSAARVAGRRNEAGEAPGGLSMVPIGFYSGDDEYAL
ncbi:MAG TPA: ComEC/Rec2 family competence protein, partial [Candidatus Binatia bacterium]|nr:ComEC/Rec2 family competence protein [Candidatus Binatia bacterium]